MYVLPLKGKGFGISKIQSPFFYVNSSLGEITLIVYRISLDIVAKILHHRSLAQILY